MNPFAGLFKRGPDALQLSDWLENMNEAFIKSAGEILSGDKSSQDMLVYFTLINTTHSAYNILHNIPSIESAKKSGVKPPCALAPALVVAT
jgi:hypothetical protein